MKRSAEDIEKRAVRRKRRIRSQILVYVTMLIIVSAICVGAVLGLRSVMSWIDEGKQEAEQVISEQQDNNSLFNSFSEKEETAEEISETAEEISESKTAEEISESD